MHHDAACHAGHVPACCTEAVAQVRGACAMQGVTRGAGAKAPIQIHVVDEQCTVHPAHVIQHRERDQATGRNQEIAPDGFALAVTRNLLVDRKTDPHEWRVARLARITKARTDRSHPLAGAFSKRRLQRTDHARFRHAVLVHQQHVRDALQPACTLDADVDRVCKPVIFVRRDQHHVAARGAEFPELRITRGVVHHDNVPDLRAQRVQQFPKHPDVRLPGDHHRAHAEPVHRCRVHSRTGVSHDAAIAAQHCASTGSTREAIPATW